MTASPHCPASLAQSSSLGSKKRHRARSDFFSLLPPPSSLEMLPTSSSVLFTTRAAIAVAFTLAATNVLAQKTPLGQPCNVTRNRLSSTSHQFHSACDDTGFCNPGTNTCTPRQCSTQLFPTQNDSFLPPLCNSGSFCPDEGDGCLSLLPVGQNCQMDRDGEPRHPPPCK